MKEETRPDRKHVVTGDIAKYKPGQDEYEVIKNNVYFNLHPEIVESGNDWQEVKKPEPDFYEVKYIKPYQYSFRRNSSYYCHLSEGQIKAIESLLNKEEQEEKGWIVGENFSEGDLEYHILKCYNDWVNNDGQTTHWAFYVREYVYNLSHQSKSKEGVSKQLRV